MCFEEYFKLTVLLNLGKSKEKHKSCLHLVQRLSPRKGSRWILRNASLEKRTRAVAQKSPDSAQLEKELLGCFSVVRIWDIFVFFLNPLPYVLSVLSQIVPKHQMKLFKRSPYNHPSGILQKEFLICAED